MASLCGWSCTGGRTHSLSLSRTFTELFLKLILCCVSIISQQNWGKKILLFKGCLVTGGIGWKEEKERERKMVFSLFTELAIIATFHFKTFLSFSKETLIISHSHFFPQLFQPLATPNLLLVSTDFWKIPNEWNQTMW